MKRENHTHMASGMSTPAYIIAVFVVVAALTTGAVFIGRSDSGQIDVSSTIQNANQPQTDADGNVTEGEQNYTPPALRNKPNGGLVPQDPSGLPATPPQEAEAENPESETETTDDEAVDETDAPEEGGEPAEPTEGDTPAESS